MNALGMVQAAYTQAGAACTIPGPFDWPNVVLTLGIAFCAVLTTYVTSITRRLDKGVRDGGE